MATDNMEVSADFSREPVRNDVFHGHMTTDSDKEQLDPEENSLPFLSTFWNGLQALGLVVAPEDDEPEEMRDAQPQHGVIDTQPVPARLLNIADTVQQDSQSTQSLSDGSMTSWSPQHHGAQHGDEFVTDGYGGFISVSKTASTESTSDWWKTAPWEGLDMDSTSTLLTKEQAMQIASKLPSRLQPAPWRLVYSTYRDGTSLKTLYRLCGGTDTPQANVLVVKDSDNNVFGGFTTDRWMLSATFHHSGQGESFLFSVAPRFVVHPWTGLNDYVMLAEPDCLHMGLSHGVYGLWLNGALTFGQSGCTDTFAGGPLTEKPHFVVMGVEVWGVGACS